MINGNVTAKLTSNIDIDGVPILVSELHIIADQASTVTCTSETTTSSNNTLFNVSGMCTVGGIYTVTFLFSTVPSKRNMFLAVHRSIPVLHAQAIN